MLLLSALQFSRSVFPTYPFLSNTLSELTDWAP